MRAINLLGWLGVIAILGAYVLVTYELFPPTSPWYLGLNLVGSLAIFSETYVKRDMQPALLNAIWAVVAFVGIVRLLLR